MQCLQIEPQIVYRYTVLYLQPLALSELWQSICSPHYNEHLLCVNPVFYCFIEFNSKLIFFYFCRILITFPYPLWIFPKDISSHFAISNSLLFKIFLHKNQYEIQFLKNFFRLLQQIISEIITITNNYSPLNSSKRYRFITSSLCLT